MGGILFGLLRRELVRLAFVATATCALVLTLAWWAPAQRELDVAAYRYGAWSVETPIAATPTDVARIQKDFGVDNILLASWWYAPLRSTSGKEIAVSAVVTPTPNSRLGLFPAEEQLSTFAVQGGAWIDIDVATASQLGVRSGDCVFFGGLDPSSQVAFTVRGVYAVAPFQSQLPVVLVSAAPIMATLNPTPDNHFPITVAWVRGLDVAEVLSRLHDPFYEKRLLADGYNFSADTVEGDAFGIRSRESWLAGAEQRSLATTSIIIGISVFAAAAMIGLLWREVTGFARRFGGRALLLHRLGVSRSRLTMTAAALAAVAVAGAVVAGGALALVLLSGVVTAAFPPSLLPPLALASAVIVILSVIGTATIVRARLLAGRLL